MSEIWSTDGVLDEIWDEVRGCVETTPLLSAAALGVEPVLRGAGAGTCAPLALWFKDETAQTTGSFKFRGAVAKLAAVRRAHPGDAVVTASAGNHGMGLAEAARRLGVRAKVFVPEKTPEVKREGIRSRGAELVVCAGGYDATEAAAKACAAEGEGHFVSPFDDPYIAVGNGGTLAREVRDTLGRWPTAFVVPVGGGGLAAGILAALSDGLADTIVFGVQSEASPAMTRSLAEGRALLTCPAQGGTLAEGLEGGVSPSTFAHARRGGLRMSTVSEREIRDALRESEARGQWLEGSSAVVLALLARWRREGAPAELAGPVVAVLTGRNRDRIELF